MFTVKDTVLLRTFLLVLFCLAVLQASAGKADYIKDYHPVVYQAEQLILEGNYRAALEKYEAVFKAVPEPFARDYYNAAVCAMLSENYKKTFNYLDELVLKGVELPYLRKQPVFKQLHETKDWKKFLKKYPKQRRKFKRNANLDVRADLDELYARDKFFRFAKGGLRVHGDTIRKIEEENVDILLRNIQKYGYPGEKLIGVGDTIEQLPRFSIVIERQTKAKKGFVFKDILLEAVQAGKLHPQAAAYLFETQEGSRYYKTRALVVVSCTNKKDCSGDKKLKYLDKHLVEDLSKKQEEKVNALRAQLGLEPLAAYRQKVLYSLSDNRFMLGYTWSVANFLVPGKDAAEVLLKGHVPAETAMAEAK